MAYVWALLPLAAQDFTLKSPGSNNVIEIYLGEQLRYSVKHQGQEILKPSPIGLSLNGQQFGPSPKLKSKKTNTVNEILRPVVRVKRAEIVNHYNELVLTFKGGYLVAFRAYDDGVAYRLGIAQRKGVAVMDESINYNFPKDFQATFPVADGFFTHYERNYTHMPVSTLAVGEMSCLPALIHASNGVKVAITESDLYDYPGFYLTKGAEKHSLKATFPKYPKTYTYPDDRDVRPATREDFIASIESKRMLPWRLMAIADEDKDLINNQLVYKLARPLAIGNTSWIKPGKVAWDWYNANNIYGVDFKSGINTATYKYYIDFAAQYGLEYIILDEGWYDIKTNDLINPVKDIDMEVLMAYGKEKNVGLVLWVTWKALEDQFDEALAKFEEWGAKGIKVDFMQRDDQWMVKYYERVAKAGAKHQLLVDFHGSYKPSGLRRAYPNVITREGVKGLEQHKWEGELANPEHDLEIPFIRMLAGPVDYTPGAMRNAQKANYYPFFERPMSLGTRCHQLAMYVVFESPLQMLADNPSNYLKEPECMKFLSKVPVVWDETVVLEGKLGDYVAVARKNGEEWYVGAMTDWEARTLSIDLSFLGAGQYKIDIYQDGVNAGRFAEDFKTITREVTAQDKLAIEMAPGGGWAARIYR